MPDEKPEIRSGDGDDRAFVSPRRTRAPRAAQTNLQHGKSVLKVYPINEDALENLGNLNRDFSLLLAGATGFGGFALDLSKDLVMATDATAVKLAYAAGTNVVCWVVALMFAAAAFAKWREKGSRLTHLKENVFFAE